MNNQSIYIAYVTQDIDGHPQLLRYAFEHPTVEYWGEADGQERLKDYFKRHHYTHQEPFVVEASEIMDIMPYTGFRGDYIKGLF